jgi:uncharacterized membrane protein YoaK (UPF0700 family)
MDWRQRVVGLYLGRLCLHSNFRQILIALLSLVAIPVSKSEPTLVILSFSLEFFDCFPVILIISIVLAVLVEHIRLQSIALPARLIIANLTSPRSEIERVLWSAPDDLRRIVLIILVIALSWKYSAISRSLRY